MTAALACVLAVGGLVAAERAGHAVARAVTKTIASTAFVAFAFQSGAADSGAGIAVLVALVLSAVGDVCLLSGERSWFLAGIVAFLLGHLAYTAAFMILGVSTWGTVAATVPLGIAATFVWRWLEDSVGSLGTAVRAYILVISAMVAAAVGAVALDPTGPRIGLLAAAVVFFASDLCVARDRFIAPGPVNRYVGLPLYYGAQLLFGGIVAAAAG